MTPKQAEVIEHLKQGWILRRGWYLTPPWQSTAKAFSIHHRVGLSLVNAGHVKWNSRTERFELVENTPNPSASA